MNFFPCQNLSRKQYSLQESFKEIVFLARILQGNLFLARFLQDVLQKNALSCKTLKENLARSLQGTQVVKVRGIIVQSKVSNQIW